MECSVLRVLPQSQESFDPFSGRYSGESLFGKGGEGGKSYMYVLALGSSTTLYMYIMSDYTYSHMPRSMHEVLHMCSAVDLFCLKIYRVQLHWQLCTYSVVWQNWIGAHENLCMKVYDN